MSIDEVFDTDDCDCGHMRGDHFGDNGECGFCGCEDFEAAP